eukprot:3931096-Pyramimonas_sp.AAC.7
MRLDAVEIRAQAGCAVDVTPSDQSAECPDRYALLFDTVCTITDCGFGAGARETKIALSGVFELGLGSESGFGSGSGLGNGLG